MSPTSHAGGGDLEADEPSLEIAGILHALLRRSWLIALGAVACGLAAGGYAQRIPTLYQSRTVIQVESPMQGPIDSENPGASAPGESNGIETLIQNFRNRSLLEHVSHELDLPNSAEFLRRPGNLPASEEEVISILASSCAVADRPKTSLVDIAFTHGNPKIAQLLATTIVDQFIQQNTEQQVKRMEAQNSLLTKKAAELKAKLERSETLVQDYKNKMESVSVDAGRNLVEAKLRDMNNNLNEARNARMSMESDLTLLRSVRDRDPVRLLNIASVASDPEVISVEARIKTAEAEIQALADRYRAKHPKMIEANNRLADARKADAALVRSAPDRIASRYEGVLANEQNLEKAVAAQEKELLKLDEKITPYRALQRELESDRALYEGVEKKLKQSALVMDIKPVNFRVVEPALPGYPLPNRRLMILAGGIAGGGMLAVGLIVGLFLLDSSIKTVDDAERLLGLPVLSAVPVLRKLKSPAQLLALINRPDSPIAESFRSLRTAVSLLGPAEKRKVILFTSALPEEGKTLSAANAAIAFAQQGLKTVILDADLRRPGMSRLFLGPDRKFPGVAEFMIGEMPEVVHTEVQNLFILPAGAQAPNPAELLAHSRFGELVEMMKQNFDRVIIDTAPVNVVSDTLSIVFAAQTIALVVRSGGTSRKVIRRAMELLRRAHVRPDGVVLNFMPDWNGIAHHYYYSGNSKYGGPETYGENYTGREVNNEPIPPRGLVIANASSIRLSE